jgi:glutathione S-transferase
MMKLFYKAGVCSLASHIVLHEVDAHFEIESVDTDAGLTASGIDYSTINPKGSVPALALDSGEVLTEGAAILQYIAESHPDSELVTVDSLIQRARLREHLNYTSSELHKAFTPLFNAATDENGKATARINVAKKFDYVNTLLSDGRLFLLGKEFSVADAYLFAVSNWANFTDINIKKWPHIAGFIQRVAERPAVQIAMRAEGLIE